MFVYILVAAAVGTAWLLVTMVTGRLAGRSTDLAAGERALIRDLPAALDNGDIYLVYQPKLSLRTGEVDGVEALVRWEHPRLGPISRKSLIPLAEERGQIRELSIWVARQALADQSRLAARGVKLAVFINISARLLGDAVFIRDLVALVSTATGEIGLEITETSLIEDSPLALRNLKRMIDQGVSISIDDYGSGLSSLAYLKELPAKELKIDKMFVSGMTHSHRDPLIVRSTIDLAHALGLTVVAEGVESLAVLGLLKVMGCDCAQGYLISQPLKIGDLQAYLEGGSFRALLAEASANVMPPSAFWTRVSRDESSDPVLAVAAG